MFILFLSHRSENFTLSKVKSLYSLEKIPVRILLDGLFRVFRFSKASDIFIHKILKLRRHLGTRTYGRLPRLICNFKCEITN